MPLPDFLYLDQIWLAAPKAVVTAKWTLPTRKQSPTMSVRSAAP